MDECDARDWGLGVRDWRRELGDEGSKPSGSVRFGNRIAGERRGREDENADCRLQIAD
jgi:hypothetical protein